MRTMPREPPLYLATKKRDGSYSMTRSMRVFWIAAVFGFCVGTARWTAAEDRIALRTTSGRFLRLAQNGFAADRLLPGDQEALELIAEKGNVAVQASDGRLFSISSAVPGGDRFRLVRIDGNRVALQRDGGSFVVLDPTAGRGDSLQPADRPHPDQTVEIFHLGYVPETIRVELAGLLRREVVDELGNQPYEKTRTRKKRRFIELPAPTLHDLKRTKRRRVLSMDETYQVRVQLDGPPKIRVVEMPYLQGYYEPAAGSLMFQVQATLPLTGRVRYKIPDVLSASTGFRTTVEILATGQVRSDKSEKGVSLHVPELVDLSVSLRGLDVANDALNLVHDPLEDLINDELGEKQERIRDKANHSIRKAIEKGEFRIPLLQWLVLPRLK